MALPKNTLYNTLFFCIVTGLIAASLAPNLSVPDKYYLDKILHVAAFFLVTLFAMKYADTRRSNILAFSCLFFLGIVTELSHLYIPGRLFSVGDMVANIVGIVVGVVVNHFHKIIK